MPNFSYTAGKAWTPYTFDEMLKPLAMYTEEYNKQEEALSALDAEASVAGAMASETNDPITYARYKNYETAIRSQADAIARHGLTPSSRKAVLDLRTRYKSEIAPIGEAIKRRRELADEIRKAQLANPTLMVLRDLNSLSPESSLDRFIENPEYNYGDTYSGALLTKQVSDMASHLSKELRNVGKGKLDEYTNTFLKNYGLSSNEVLLAINNPNDPRASRALNAIYNAALESVPQSLREKYADDINSYINQGFWSAIGQNQISTYEDYENRLRALKLSQIDIARAKAGYDNPPSSSLGPRIIEGVEGQVNPNVSRMEGFRPTTDGISTIALDKKEADYKRAKERYENYIKDRDTRADEYYETYLESLKSNDVAKALRTTPRNAPAGYEARARLKKEFKRAEKAYNEERAFLDLMELEYSHLGSTKQERLLMGYNLSKVLQKRETTSYPLNAKESLYNDIRNGLLNVINAAPEALFKSGFGLVDKDGDVLDRDDALNILNNTDNKLSIKVKTGPSAGLKVVHNGKEYDIKGIEEVDRYNNYLRTINNYLSDFSSNILLGVTSITPDVLLEINTYGILNARIPVDDKKFVNIGNEYLGTTLYEPQSGEYIKLLIDNRGNVIAANSLSDTLQGGTLIDTYMNREANRGLNSLIDLFARKYE